MLVSWRRRQSCTFLHVFSRTGRQFIAAEELLFSARHASYWESLDAGINCFMLAIEVGTLLTEGMGEGKGVNIMMVYDNPTLYQAQAHVKQKNDVMAAMYCLEIAHRLKVRTPLAA